jgi:glycine/D-amino acid oxidase-like deaminating enzyme
MVSIDPKVLRHLSMMQPALYWLDADPLEPESRPSLVEEIDVDLCIIGAGYTGLWTALIAKERDPDRNVIILEAKETGAGASGRNGGFCNSSLTHGFINGYNRFKDEMEIVEKLGRENFNAIEKTIEKYGIDCGWERTGELKVATKPWEYEELKREAALRNSYGDEVEVLSADQVRSRINSPIYLGALWDEDGTALVDPARLVWGLERACLSLGVTIYEHSPAEGLHDDGDKVIVSTPYGKVRADRIALATNVYDSLLRKTKKYVVPVYDFQLVTEPLSAEQLKSINWSNREGVSEAGNQFHYYRLTKENEILWGGYDAIYNFRGHVNPEYEDEPETYARLARDFLKTFPQLEGIKFTHGWGGAIDTCSRFSPFWGVAMNNKVAYVLGFTGLGVGATRFGGEIMIDLLDGIESEGVKLKMVQKKPIPFPPEPFRFFFIRLTQFSLNRADQTGKRNLWLKLLDRLGLGFDS